MPRLPDRFDLWVRKARQCTDPARQADYILGALAALPAWHFLNLGTAEKPLPAQTEIDAGSCLLVFTDRDRVEEVLAEQSNPPTEKPLPIITMNARSALVWCMELSVGLLVNPGEDAVLIPLAQLEAFHAEWTQSLARQGTGYWIPNMTSEEDDFWQEHGL